MGVLDRVTMKAATVYARLTMSSPIYRDRESQFPMTVQAVGDLGGGMRRVTFAAAELKADFALVGADEYFGLLMPRPGTALQLPDSSRQNVRAAIAAMPAEQQPDLRWYTIRRHDQAAGTIDVDIVTHGDAGPGSAWALAATPSQLVGFRSGGALFRGHECSGEFVVVADETALPALAAIIDQHPQALDRATIIVEVPQDDILAGYDLTSRVSVSIHKRGTARPGALALPALQALDTRYEYAWICGESGLVTECRRHLVKISGMDRRSILFSGYWKLGQARG